MARQDPCDTERRVSAGIDPRNPGPLYFRESTTLEVAHPIGRHRSLLDKLVHIAFIALPFM